MRFVDKDPSGCWLWTGVLNIAGYGRFSVRHDYQLAHRWAYDRWVGPVGDLYVCHTCDVRRCVNPAHLFLGTQGANLADMIAKGRSARGTRVATAKLTEVQVLAVWEGWREGDRYSDWGRDLGVDGSAIRQIVLGKTWRHVTGGRP